MVYVSGSAHCNIFPPVLKRFAIDPEHIIFIELRQEREILWVMEEALKCEGITAVIAELRELSFTQSQRLQLAVEQSKVTGFVLRNDPKKMNATACAARWQIKPLPSIAFDELPGVCYARWSVELLKVKNGLNGSRQLEWV